MPDNIVFAIAYFFECIFWLTLSLGSPNLSSPQSVHLVSSAAFIHQASASKVTGKHC